MNILVTGGSGFIGNCFIKLLIAKYPNYHIVNLDKLTYAGNKDNLKSVEHNPRYTFVQGDICDAVLVNKIIINHNIDIIVNFAAETHVDRSILNPDAFVRTDIFGMFVLLEATRNHNIKKLIHISTDEVYGDILEGSFIETDALAPSSPYSASKAAADLLARSYIRTHNTPVIITRSSNNSGPYQYPEKIIPCFVTKLLQGQKIPLHNSLPVRDWIHVQDNCEAIDFIMHHGRLGEIYNIGGGNEKTNQEITKIILDSFGYDESYIEYVNDRKGQDMRYSLNCEKIHRLGWKPRIPFEQGIRETIEWYKQNKWWWQKINKIVIAGANRTGHAGVVLNTLRIINEHSIVGFLDNNPHVDKVPDIPLLGGTDPLPDLTGVEGAIVAIGENTSREQIANQLKAKGLKLINVVHPNAYIAPGVILGEGVFIGPGAVVNSGTRIGNNVIISAGTVVEHNVTIGDNVFIGPASVIDGRAKIENNVSIPTGTKVPLDAHIKQGEHL
jgi:dTDP-glucose 4,6-dehydratase